MSEEIQSEIATLVWEIKELRKQLSYINEIPTALGSKICTETIYNNKEIKEVLKVNDKLLKRYRDEGLLSYHRINDKYWYQGSDIIEFLNHFRTEAFK